MYFKEEIKFPKSYKIQKISKSIKYVCKALLLNILKESLQIEMSHLWISMICLQNLVVQQLRII